MIADSSGNSCVHRQFREQHVHLVATTTTAIAGGSIRAQAAARTDLEAAATATATATVSSTAATPLAAATAAPLAAATTRVPGGAISAP